MESRHCETDYTLWGGCERKRVLGLPPCSPPPLGGASLLSPTSKLLPLSPLSPHTGARPMTKVCMTLWSVTRQPWEHGGSAHH